MQYQLPRIGRALGWAYRNGLWASLPAMAIPLCAQNCVPQKDPLSSKRPFAQLRGVITDGMLFLEPGDPTEGTFSVKLTHKKSGYAFEFPSKVLAFLKSIEADQILVVADAGFVISTMREISKHYPGFNLNVPELVGSTWGVPERETPWSMIVPQRGDALVLNPRDICDFMEPTPDQFWIHHTTVLSTPALVISKHPQKDAIARTVQADGKLLVTPDDYVGLSRSGRDALRVQAVPGFGWLLHRTSRAAIIPEAPPCNTPMTSMPSLDLTGYLAELPVIGQKHLPVLRFRGYLTALDITGRELGWAGFHFNDRLDVIRGPGFLQLVPGQQLAPRVVHRNVLRGFIIRVSHRELAWLGDVPDRLTVLVQAGRITIFNKKLADSVPKLPATYPAFNYSTLDKAEDGSFHIPSMLCRTFALEDKRFSITPYHHEIQLHADPAGEFTFEPDGSIHIPAKISGRVKLPTAVFGANLRHAFLCTPTGA